MLTPRATFPILGVTGRVLEEYQPPKPMPVGRKLLVTQELHSLLRTPDTKLMFPSYQAEVILSRFCAGYYLGGSLKSAKDCDIERLENIGEVWAICLRKPRPGWRLFGRFAQRDVFVATAAYDRHELAGANYAAKALDAIFTLNKEFPQVPEHIGGMLSDYMSGPIYDMDE